MRFTNVLLNFFHLLGILFFIATGAFFMLGSLHQGMKNQIDHIVDFLKGFLDAKGLFFIGIFFVLYGILILTLLLLGLKNVYLRVACKAPKVLVDQAIVHDYIDDYLKKVFHEPTPYFNLIFHENNTLEIHTKIPEAMDKIEVIQQIENELGVLLARKLGYKNEFILTLHET